MKIISPINLVLFSLIIVLSTACQDLVVEKKITGRYYIIGVDTSDNLRLSYEVDSGNYIGITKSNIKSIGFNKKYIITSSHIEDKKNAHYFIIPLEKEVNQYWVDTLKIGPLNKSEFDRKSSELDIEDLKFTMFF
ncbi:MAG: hypothetical protein WBG46_07225 [Nonlabens sp.]